MRTSPTTSLPAPLLLGLAVVALLSSLLATPASAATETTVVLSPSDDATVRESDPATNYGGRSTLEVDASSRKDILLRFDVTGVGTLSVAKATLRLHALDPSSVGGTLTVATDTSWSQDSVTWETAPAADGPEIGSLGEVSAGNWYELDVTGFVTGDGPVGFRMTSSSSNGADYSSSETATDGPRLELVLNDGGDDVEPPSAPTGLTANEVTADRVQLSWEASTDNVAVVGYDVFRDGGVVGSVGAVTSFVDESVATGSTYSYHLVARDGAGNRSADGASLSVTVPQPGPASVFDVWRDGETYTASAQDGGASYSGRLKAVVERALDDLRLAGGGSVLFGAGDFDLGTEHFEIQDLTDVVFAGQGMGVTTIRNFTDEAADTEPFDAVRSDRLTIRDLSVSAGGSERTTSDALDFDGGDDILIERVEVVEARGRGIVFDGKDAPSSTGGTAERNTVRDCVVRNTPRDGIQLLASNYNTVENCVIDGAGAMGIRVHLSSSTSAQPLKPSNDNRIVNNTISNAADSGIAVTGGSRNVIAGNSITGSAAQGVRIYTSTSTLFCDDNVVDGNTITGSGGYGISVESSNCRRTIIGTNVLDANGAGPIRDDGTGTVYPPVDPDASIMLAPTDDAHVRQSDPDTNYGDWAWLEVDANSRKDILLRFEVVGVGDAAIESATLRLYNVDSASFGGDFTATTDTSWSQDTVTWNNAPAADGASLGSLGRVSRDTWYELDVTSLINGDGPISIRVSSPSSNGADYASGESDTGNGPQLVIVRSP